MKHIWVSTAGFTAVLLTGCTTVYEGKYDFNDGWREAKVVEVASASEIKKPQFSDCRESAIPQQLSTGRFAVLSYMRMGRERTHVAPLKPNEPLRPGDLVYVNVTHCDNPVVPRIQQIVK